MATDNTVTMIGNLTDDPELRFTANGAAVANFRLAVTPPRPPGRLLDR
jgi:single-strand DNA-binding protein